MALEAGLMNIFADWGKRGGSAAVGLLNTGGRGDR
jgi:hypothetical protein